jgi:hypothetical protein
MSTGIEHRLKAEMDRVPVAMPSDIVSRAHRAYRRHRVITRSAAISGAVAVIAAVATVLSLATVPFSAAPGKVQPATPPAGSVPRASLQPTPPPDSLTAAQASTDIFFVHYTTSTRKTTDTFYYGLDNRGISYNPDGSPATDNSLSVKTATVTSVDYASKTWESQGVSVPPASGSQAATLCSTATRVGLFDVDVSQLGGAGSLLACPGLTVTRGQRVDGLDAIKISIDDDALWVNATTHLPIKMQARHPTETDIWEFGYLPATPANLASYLSVAIPQGFMRGGSLTVPIQPWTPPTGVAPPFGLTPVPAGDGLTASQAKGDVLWTRTTTQAIPASDTLVESTFSYKSAASDVRYFPDGKPWVDYSGATSRNPSGTLTWSRTSVNWQNRTYSIVSEAGSSTSAVQLTTCDDPQMFIDFQDTPDAARALLNCPGLKVSRGKSIDGIAAITIAASDPMGSRTLWINAKTYLPIQLVTVNPTGHNYPDGYKRAPSPGRVEQFSWLPPTPANLAYVAAPIPAGFTRVQ